MDNDLYNQFRKAHSQYNLGKTFKIIGIVFAAAGVVSIAAGGESNSYTVYNSTGGVVYSEGGGSNYSSGITFLALGVASYIPGIIIKKKAANKIDEIVEKNNYGKYSSTNMSFSPSLMMTAKNDIGVGISLALSF